MLPPAATRIASLTKPWRLSTGLKFWCTTQASTPRVPCRPVRPRTTYGIGAWPFKRALPALLKGKGSSVLFMGSVAGTVAWEGDVAYNVAKAGLHHLTKCIAVD